VVGIDGREFTVAAFNAHWGIGRFGKLRGVPYDVAAAIESFEADVVVVPESWRAEDGVSVLDPLVPAGYHVESVEMMRLAKRRDHTRESVPSNGGWELAIASRFPIVARKELPIGNLKADPAGARYALVCTLDIDGRPVEIVGIHTSSKVWLLAPVRHMLTLRRQIEQNGSRPHIIAGDFNFWGPAVSACFPGWRRTVRGRTYPSTRPHSQIDHVLVTGDIDVLSAEVLPATPSDHRPIRTRLRLRGQVS
jgi:endonuclease/exonuclease/phosphatase family metal-dependent hydrolase